MSLNTRRFGLGQARSAHRSQNPLQVRFAEPETSKIADAWNLSLDPWLTKSTKYPVYNSTSSSSLHLYCLRIQVSPAPAVPPLVRRRLRQKWTPFPRRAGRLPGASTGKTCPRCRCLVLCLRARATGPPSSPTLLPGLGVYIPKASLAERSSKGIRVPSSVTRKTRNQPRQKFWEVLVKCCIRHSPELDSGCHGVHFLCWTRAQCSAKDRS